MEKLMLQSLDYHLIAPSSTSFLHHYLDIGTQQSHSSANLQTSVQHLAQVRVNPYYYHVVKETFHPLQYLCEMALVHSDPFLKYLPSEVAAASVCLSRHTLDQQPAWVCRTPFPEVFVFEKVWKLLFYPLFLFHSPIHSNSVLDTRSVISATVFRTCIECLPWHPSSLSRQYDSSTALRGESLSLCVLF